MKKIQLKPNFINPVTINSPSSIFAKLFTRNLRALASFYSTDVEFAK